ncbi:hypothetical protein JCM1393_21590 [Clostridium carnis]
MQIEIINKRTNNSINLDSYVYSSGVLINVFNSGKVGATFNKSRGIGQHGYTLLSTTLEDREVYIKATIIANDRTERDSIKNNIDDVINPLDNIIIKYDNAGISKEIECSAEESPEYSTEYKTNNDFILEFEVSFECFKPFWVDQNRKVVNVETWEGGFEFDFELSSLGIEFAQKGANEIEINNIGNIDSPLEVYFKGPALNPCITLNNNKFIKVNRNLTEEEVLYINTSFDNKAVEVIRGDIVERAYHYIDIESSFFSLNQGLNKISYATDGDFLPQSVIIKYKCHYFNL